MPKFLSPKFKFGLPMSNFFNFLTESNLYEIEAVILDYLSDTLYL